MNAESMCDVERLAAPVRETFREGRQRWLRTGPLRRRMFTSAYIGRIAYAVGTVLGTLAVFSDLVILLILVVLANIVAIPMAWLYAWRYWHGIVDHPLEPVRVLLLRPFGDQGISRPLTTLVRGHVAHASFVFTLSDRDVRENLQDGVAFPTPLAAWISLRYRFRGKVRSERSLAALVARLDKAPYLLRAWILSNDKIFKVKPVRSMWQRTVEAVAENVELILIDVSDVGPGLQWELEQLLHERYEHKTVYIRAEWSALIGHPSVVPEGRRAWEYTAESNMKDSAGFRTDLCHTIAKGLQETERRAWAAKECP